MLPTKYLHKISPDLYSHLLPKGDLSPPEFPNILGCTQLRPLHKFGQHLPPMALHSLSCRHLGVQFWTLVDEGQSTRKIKKGNLQQKLRQKLESSNLPPAAKAATTQAAINRERKPSLTATKVKRQILSFSAFRANFTFIDMAGIYRLNIPMMMIVDSCIVGGIYLASWTSASLL